MCSSDLFSKFKNADLKDYSKFKNIIIAFREYYGLEEFNLKEIDQYLWQLGKEYFRFLHFKGQGQGFENFDSLGHDFGANAVARQKGDFHGALSLFRSGGKGKKAICFRFHSCWR